MRLYRACCSAWSPPRLGRHMRLHCCVHLCCCPDVLSSGRQLLFISHVTPKARRSPYLLAESLPSLQGGFVGSRNSLRPEPAVWNWEGEVSLLARQKGIIQTNVPATPPHQKHATDVQVYCCFAVLLNRFTDVLLKRLLLWLQIASSWLQDDSSCPGFVKLAMQETMQILDMLSRQGRHSNLSSLTSSRGAGLTTSAGAIASSLVDAHTHAHAQRTCARACTQICMCPCTPNHVAVHESLLRPCEVQHAMVHLLWRIASSLDHQDGDSGRPPTPRQANPAMSTVHK